VLLVPKKDGTWRFAVDFRHVNKHTNMDPSTIPNAKLHLHALGGNNFFTCLDLLSSFWQQPLHPDDRHYTAFSMPGVGQLQWTVLPMGMRNSSQTQQKAMEDLVRGLDPDHVMCYIDDIIIATSDFEQHLILIDLLFRRLEAAGLALKFTKCEILRSLAHYLGHIISADRVAKDPRIVTKLCDLPTPTNVAELRAFLGVTNYYRDYIPNYSDMTTPLTDQVSPKQLWSWTTVHQRAFEATKAAMQAAQLLAYPNWDQSSCWPRTRRIAGSAVCSPRRMAKVVSSPSCSCRASCHQSKHATAPLNARPWQLSLACPSADTTCSAGAFYC
jgi:hypothetical protein